MECKVIVSALIRNKDKILIVKRCENDRFKPCAWELPGGKVEVGELIIDGIIREIKEESNISVEKDHVLFIRYKEIIEEQNGALVRILLMSFLVEFDEDNIDVAISDEHMDYMWVDKDSNLLSNRIKELLSIVNKE